MKALMLELRRWSKQRAVRCRDCEALDDVMRLRAPLAAYVAGRHEQDNAGHRVKVSRVG